MNSFRTNQQSTINPWRVFEKVLEKDFFDRLSCNSRMTDFGRWCRFPFVMEVWIYFLFLEFWPGAEIGTLPSIFQIIYRPQHIAVPFDLGCLKTALDNLFHPAKIQPVLPALK